MPLHFRFEWDAEKDRSNQRKHQGVSFDLAAHVLVDPMADRFQTDEHQVVRGEERCLTFASDPENRDLILAIVWTERIRDGLTYTRIISARYAESWERKAYEQEVYKK